MQSDPGATKALSHGSFLTRLQQAKSSQRTLLGVLVDPDHWGARHTHQAFPLSLQAADFVLVGGSLLGEGNVEQTCQDLRRHTDRPLVLFPGDAAQLTEAADALLLLSLISGRNPEYLIGQHVRAAPRLLNSNLEVVPTGYMLVESPQLTTAHYMSGQLPLPAAKPDIARFTGYAGQLLGMQALYLDCGSGALAPPQPSLVRAVSATCRIPLLVGGGIRTVEQALPLARAGATALVVGTALEQDASKPLLQEVRQQLAEFSETD